MHSPGASRRGNAHPCLVVPAKAGTHTPYPLYSGAEQTFSATSTPGVMGRCIRRDDGRSMPATGTSCCGVGAPLVIGRHLQRNLPMQTPREILADLWTGAGGDAAALGDVTLTGEENRSFPRRSASAPRRRPASRRPDSPRRKSGNCGAGNRRTSRSTCATPSSNAAASAICVSTASRRGRPGTRSPESTRPAMVASCGCTPISGIIATPSARF